MVKIFEISEKLDLFEEAVVVFWKQWGSESNFTFYYDCMKHSCTSESDLPKFYIAMKDNSIVGTYALLRNDLISLQDLFPWFACLYIVPAFRGNKLGSLLLDHALKEASKKGFNHLYLSTDLENYYEKYQWEFLDEGYGFNGHPSKIYVKSTQTETEY